ncbi:MAG: FeoA family protein, partial [Turicibacter sp.]|nr:FeoA family protein [Turicibacter sp.]
MKLSGLRIGESALILDFKELSDTFSRRLYDVGISIGSEVTMLNILNFGQLFYISID